MPPHSSRPARRQQGLSLVEASAAVALLGTALAVFVPVFFRELRTSRIAEAPENLARLHALSAVYFDTSHVVAGESLRRCLPDATGRAPLAPSPVAQEVDFSADGLPGGASFQALGFSPDRPLYFSYEVTPTLAGCGLEGEGPQLLLRAYGDLDGDGLESTFERASSIDPESLTLVPDGALQVRNRTE